MNFFHNIGYYLSYITFDYYLLSSCNLRYGIDGWRKFMSDNQLRFGDLLHFTFITSQHKIILTDVTPV
ncbi:putative DNA-binding pseudobarrel domain superfamily [Helianthus anomalus]